jgi:hypothetical protein
MKFIDIINEEARIFKKPNEDEEKRVKTIFKALKKGSVNVNYPNYGDKYKVRYHINDNVFYRWEVYSGMYYIVINTNNFPGEGMTVYCKDKDVINDVRFRSSFISDIRQKFDKFDVNIHLNSNGINFVLDEPDQPEEMNEQKVMDNQVTPQQVKKVRTVYKGIKSGVVNHKTEYNNGTMDISKYKYVLPDDYLIMLGEENVPCVVLTTDPNKGIELYYIPFPKNEPNYLEYPVKKEHDALYKWITDKVVDRFKSFNIKFLP